MKRVTRKMTNYTTWRSGNYLAVCGEMTRGFRLQLMKVKVETGVQARASAPGSHAQPLKAHTEKSPTAQQKSKKYEKMHK